MATATVATSAAPVSANTVAKVKKAVTTPGAKGAKGFLLWANAALAGQPKVLKAITQAAAKHVPATSPGVGRFGSFAFLGRSRARVGMRGFGQTGGTAYGIGNTAATMPIGYTAAGSTGYTGATATAAATPSSAGSTGWASDILGAVTAAGTAATTIAAIKSNLTYAQQGLAPVAYTVAPTAVTGGMFGSGTGPLGMSSGLFWFMLLGAGALVYFGEKDKKG